MAPAHDREDSALANPEFRGLVCLDEIGRRIWDLLETPRTIGEVCPVLMTEYAGDEVAADAAGFLNELYDEGLVVLA